MLRLQGSKPSLMRGLQFYTLLLLFLFITSSILAQQNTIDGVVYELQDGSKQPLPLANVYWMDGSLGVVTDDKGRFSIQRNQQQFLIASFVGYKSDTLQITSSSTSVEFALRPSGNQLNEVSVVQREKATKVDLFGAVKVETITQKELLKAACCNLSESFETNPSIDVSIADAVTGTKQIQMLGLAGPYAQITRENMPDVRGLSAVSGLTYVPGHWISSIQLNKGTGSVVNGYESITGQINVNLVDPSDMDRMYLNLYSNAVGRMEANANFKKDVGEKLGTALLIHASGNQRENDGNVDGFLDLPMGKNLMAINRWELYSSNWHVQLGLRGVLVDKTSGQIDREQANRWTASNESDRQEAWAKIGKVHDEELGKSTGLQLSLVNHNHRTRFGARTHDAQQQSFYANLVHQTIVNNTNHTLKLGSSYQLDRMEEVAFDSTNNYTASVPGVFSEYTWKHGTAIDVVLGLRADMHNLYGILLTPRLHTRFCLSEFTVLRASGGRGARMPGVIAENMGAFASNRQLTLPGYQGTRPNLFGVNYHLGLEKAWNYGMNFTHKFNIDFRQAVFAVDFYRTEFENQVIVDYDANPGEIAFYNSEDYGLRSFANSIQVQFDYELINRLDVRLAYRFLDVQMDYLSNGRMEKPLQSRHRAFINAGYETLKHYRFDLTVNWMGEKRLPITSSNPAEYQLAERSPDYFLVNAQVSKAWEKQGLEVYLGGENLLNFKQEEPILSSEDPFNPYFDASMIWGPVFGRNLYAGLRYKLK